jgi:hypothetical protein
MSTGTTLIYHTTCIYIYIWVYICIYICIYIFTCIHVCMYMYIYVKDIHRCFSYIYYIIYIYICIYRLIAVSSHLNLLLIYICMYIYTYIYIHMYIQINIYSATIYHRGCDRRVPYKKPSRTGNILDDDDVYLYKLQTRVLKNLHHMLPYRPARKA